VVPVQPVDKGSLLTTLGWLNLVLKLRDVRGGFALNNSEWMEHIEKERQAKNRFFILDPRSPVPLEERKSLLRKGLSYYPPDPGLLFELSLHEHEEKKQIKVETTKEGVRKFIRWGEFRFDIDDKHTVIQAYKSDPEEEGLWIPFRDETSGKETYGAGRYIDLEPGQHLTADRKWILDFNKAYNPWCAYSDEYVCPFIPPENWLEIPIRAGEKKYPLEKG
jgi:uncharacterized protein (DUF1684 family)